MAHSHVERLLAHSDWTRELARTLVRDPSVADEIAQDAVLLALRRRIDDVVDARAWFGRVVRNLIRRRARTEVRRADRERAGARPESVAATADLVERADTHRHLVACVLELSEPHRTVLLQRYFDGLAPREIARSEGCAVSTVSNRLTKAHAALRERLGSAGSKSGRDHWLAAIAPLFGSSRAGGAGVAAPVSGAATTVAALFSIKAVAAAAFLCLAALVWWWAGIPPAPLAPLPIPTIAADRLEGVQPPVSDRPQAEPPREQVRAGTPSAHKSPADRPATVATTSMAAVVVARATGQPVPDVTVRVAPITRRGPAPEPLEVTTTRDGTVEFPAVPVGAVTVELLRNGELWWTTPTPLLLTDGVQSRFRWVLALHADVYGQFADAGGRPVPDEEIVLATPDAGARELFGLRTRDRVVATATTGPHGRFAFEHVPPGKYLIGARGEAWVSTVDADGVTSHHIRARPPAPLLEELVVPRNTERVEVQVRAWLEKFISGTVQFSDGRPAPDIQLIGAMIGARGYMETVSGSEGRFRLGPVPDGQFTIRDSNPPDGWGVFGRVSAAAGDRGVTIVLQRGGAVGGVIANSSAPAPVRGWIWVQQSETGPSPGSASAAQTTVDDAGGGRFHFESLEPATYSVAFTSDDHRWCAHLPDVVVASASDLSSLDLTLQPAAHLHVESDAGGEWTRVDVRTGGRRFLIRVARAGTALDLAVPTGPLEIVLSHPQTEGVQRHSVEAIAGETLELQFESRPTPRASTRTPR